MEVTTSRRESEEQVDIQYSIDGVATVPVPDDYELNDIIVTTTVQYAREDGELLTVDAWDNQIINVEKEVRDGSGD